MLYGNSIIPVKFTLFPVIEVDFHLAVPYDQRWKEVHKRDSAEQTRRSPGNFGNLYRKIWRLCRGNSLDHCRLCISRFRLVHRGSKKLLHSLAEYVRFDMAGFLSFLMQMVHLLDVSKHKHMSAWLSKCKAEMDGYEEVIESKGPALREWMRNAMV